MRYVYIKLLNGVCERIRTLTRDLYTYSIRGYGSGHITAAFLVVNLQGCAVIGATHQISDQG